MLTGYTHKTYDNMTHTHKTYPDRTNEKRNIYSQPFQKLYLWNKKSIADSLACHIRMCKNMPFTSEEHIITAPRQTDRELRQIKSFTD